MLVARQNINYCSFSLSLSAFVVVVVAVHVYFPNEKAVGSYRK